MRILFILVVVCSLPVNGTTLLIADPAGDTVGTGAVQPDITGHSAILTGDTATFTIHFAQAISAPSASQPTSVFGFIDLDTDRNPDTGVVPFSNTATLEFLPPLVMGMDRFIDLSSELNHSGQVDFVSPELDVLATVSVVYTASSLSLSFPLTLSGSSFSYAVVVGSFEEVTDRAPNGVVPSAPIPEPTTASLILTAVLAAITGGTARKLALGRSLLRKHSQRRERLTGCGASPTAPG
jgi:hypothetical protein